jgi:hypothetical protein
MRGEVQMSQKLRDGAMILLAAGGVLALAASAEFGLSAVAVGAGLSAASGVLAILDKRNKPEKKHTALPKYTSLSRSGHRPVESEAPPELVGHR